MQEKKCSSSSSDYYMSVVVVRYGQQCIFFCFSIDLPSMSRLKGYCFLLSSQKLTSWSWTLEGLFELTRHPPRALDLPGALLLGLNTYKDTVRCDALGSRHGGPRTSSRTTDATLDCAFVENALFYTDP